MWGGSEGEGGGQGMKTNPHRFLTLGSALQGPIRAPMAQMSAIFDCSPRRHRQVDVW